MRVRTNAGGYRHRVKLRHKQTISPKLRNHEGKTLDPQTKKDKKPVRRKNRE